MAKYILINAITIAGIGRLFPGTVYNDQFDNIARLQSSGATLWSYGDATVKAASDRVLAGKSTGLAHEDAGAIMLAAVGVSNAAGTAAAQAAANAIAGSGLMVCDEWTNPAAPSTTALLIATATTVATQTILAAALSSSGKTACAAYPRNFSVTTGGANATHGPSSVTAIGTDFNDEPLTETLALSQTAGTDLGVKAFKTYTSFALSGSGGTDATFALGIGKAFGFTRPIKNRAGSPNIGTEISSGGGSVGTVMSAAESPPNGTYAPSATPNGTYDYAQNYEQDLT